jgi:hypothetical protein
MNRRTFILTLGAIAGFTLGMSQARAAANFSGDWKLNTAKSDFGPMPAPDKLTMKIDHKEPAILIKQEQSGAMGDMNVDMKYTTDGKESTNTMGPMEVKSTAKWEGDVLVINSKLNANGADITIVGKWSLSADGKTLTNDSHVATPQGEIDMKYVMEKQEAAKEAAK